jgi:hypothetical protein
LSTNGVVDAIDNIGKLAAGDVDTDGKLHSLVHRGLRTSKGCYHEENNSRKKPELKIS